MQLNQYYTENEYGDALVESLTLSSPSIALDLGFGAGSLLHAAKRRWNNISLVGVDIDKRNIDEAKTKQQIDTLELNGFDPDLPHIINDRFGKIDLLVSNPPYFAHQLDNSSKKILDSIGLLDCISKKLKKVPAELVFMAQNLRLLSADGELGIIVPAGLVSGQTWKPVRDFLFSNYDVTNVIQLPVHSFKRTDAQTFIMTLKHKTSVSKTISLSHIEELKHILIKPTDAALRSDYNYYKEISKTQNKKGISSGNFFLIRGNKSHKNLSGITDSYIHTTNMPKPPTKRKFDTAPLDGAKNFQAGDILIARVGRRCLGRVMYIKKGSIPISDCIIAIRPKTPAIGRAIWKKLTTKDFTSYLENSSLGVGAKYITYKTITDYLTSNIYATTK